MNQEKKKDYNIPRPLIIFFYVVMISSVVYMAFLFRNISKNSDKTFLVRYHEGVILDRIDYMLDEINNVELKLLQSKYEVDRIKFYRKMYNDSIRRSLEVQRIERKINLLNAKLVLDSLKRDVLILKESNGEINLDSVLQIYKEKSK